MSEQQKGRQLLTCLFVVVIGFALLAGAGVGLMISLPDNADQLDWPTEAPEDLTATAFQELSNAVLGGNWEDDETRNRLWDRWVPSVLTTEQAESVVVWTYEAQTHGVCRMHENLSVSCSSRIGLVG